MEVDVARNLREVVASLPEGVRLIAISKYHPADYIQAAYDEGQRVFGESHEQELAKKVSILPKDIEWHFIGHLQTNKVRLIAPYISMIESVDSLKLLREINKQAEKCGRTINVLLELHVAKEATKYGFTPEQCLSMLNEGEWRGLRNIRICGLMAMASFTEDTEQVAEEFETAKRCFNDCKQQFFADAPYFKECSWGMSDDYPIALRHGSTMVRIGTHIFGPRVY